MAVHIDTGFLHGRAVRQTGDIIAGIRREQLDGATPCARWNVREVVNHVVGVSANFARIGTGGAWTVPPRIRPTSSGTTPRAPTRRPLAPRRRPSPSRGRWSGCGPSTSARSPAPWSRPSTSST